MLLFVNFRVGERQSVQLYFFDDQKGHGKITPVELLSCSGFDYLPGNVIHAQMVDP